MNRRDSLFGLPLFPPAVGRGAVEKATVRLVADVLTRQRRFSPARARRQLSHEEEEVWLARGERRALALFQEAAQRVPAYRDFLAQQGIKPKAIKTIRDFRQLPVIDKENYLRQYPPSALAWDGKLAQSQMVSVSSGSSGKPFFWPRGHILDAETALEHELFLTTMFGLDHVPTLFVVCFAMGMYVAGPITMTSVLHLGSKGYPVTVVTPGYSPDDVLNIIPDLAPQYEQVVIAGYPPYVKEILDQGIERGIAWDKIRPRLVLAGEGFNETWRTYVAHLAGNISPLRDIINLYGSADAAVLAHETVGSILIRRRVGEDVGARNQLFHSERLPSFMQYYPEHKFFEVHDEELLFTAPGGIPLIRYNIHDRGGILTREQIFEVVPETRENYEELVAGGEWWHLPFLYVFGKSDQTAIVYGANVYPENIKRALEDEDFRHYFSGRFLMYTDLDENKDQRFRIDVECAGDVQQAERLMSRLSHHIHEILLAVNSEYRSSFRGTGSKMIPLIRLLSRHDPSFGSNRSIKHKWHRNSIGE